MMFNKKKPVSVEEVMKIKKILIPIKVWSEL